MWRERRQGGAYLPNILIIFYFFFDLCDNLNLCTRVNPAGGRVLRAFNRCTPQPVNLCSASSGSRSRLLATRTRTRGALDERASAPAPLYALCSVCAQHLLYIIHICMGMVCICMRMPFRTIPDRTYTYTCMHAMLHDLIIITQSISI